MAPNRKPKQRWFRYTKGERGNRTVCWSEQEVDRDAVFSMRNSRVSNKYASPSLADELERTHETISKPVLTPTITRKPSPISIGRLPEDEPEEDESNASPKEPTSPELSKNEPSLQNARKEANEALKAVTSVAKAGVDSAVETATTKVNEFKDTAGEVTKSVFDKVRDTAEAQLKKLKNLISGKKEVQSGGRRKTKRRHNKPKRRPRKSHKRSKKTKKHKRRTKKNKRKTRRSR
jgi:hypothetical protein